MDQIQNAYVHTYDTEWAFHARIKEIRISDDLYGPYTDLTEYIMYNQQYDATHAIPLRSITPELWFKGHNCLQCGEYILYTVGGIRYYAHNHSPVNEIEIAHRIICDCENPTKMRNGR